MKEKIKITLDKVKEEGIELNKEIDNLISEYTTPFDAKNKEIREASIGAKGDLTVDELSAYIVELQSYLSYISSGQEKIGIMMDNAKLIYMEQYNKSWESISGTKDDKVAFSEKNSIDEQLVYFIYSRAYKALQERVEVGIESLSALKKALTIKADQILMEKRNMIFNNN